MGTSLKDERSDDEGSDDEGSDDKYAASEKKHS